jgi:hypothetical protein
MLLRCESVEPPMSQLGQRETRALPCSGRLSWSLATFEADILGLWLRCTRAPDARLPTTRRRPPIGRSVP